MSCASQVCKPATRACAEREDSNHEPVFNHEYVSYANNEQVTEGQGNKMENMLSASVGPAAKKTRILINLTTVEGFYPSLETNGAERRNDKLVKHRKTICIQPIQMEQYWYQFFKFILCIYRPLNLSVSLSRTSRTVFTCKICK